MRRPIRSILAALSPVVILAACQDTPTAPRQNAVEATGAMPDFSITANYATDYRSADIRVSTSGGWFVLGRHAVYFPRNSICSLGSSYGVTEWDKPCVAARGPVDFHVEIRRNLDGSSWLHFSPEVRFVPSTNRAKWVMLYMLAGGSPQEVRNATPIILWSPDGVSPGIDESLTDPTLITRVVPGTSVVYRRIKHFSNYMVGMGFSDTAEELGEGEADGAGGQDGIQ